MLDIKIRKDCYNYHGRVVFNLIMILMHPFVDTVITIIELEVPKWVGDD
jgi:hypothetical protein